MLHTHDRSSCKFRKRFLSVLASFLCLWIIAGSGVSPARAQWTKLATFDGYISCVRFVNDTLGFVGLGLSPGMPLTAPPIKVYRTTDGGLTWNPATVPQGYSGEICDIQMADTKNGRLAITGGRCALWKTTDGGVTWNETSLFGTGTSVRVTPSAIVVTNLFGLGYISTDGGLTFQNTYFSSTNGMDFVDANHGAISGFRAPNWLYTADGGLTWQASNLNIEGWSVYGAKGTSDFYAAPEGNTYPIHDQVYKSSDYGATWKSIATLPFKFTGDIEGIGEDVLFFQVHWWDAAIAQGFYYSTDKGVTWTNIGGPNMYGDTRFDVLNRCYDIALYGYGDEYGKTLYRYIFPNTGQTAGTLTASAVSLPPISACFVADTSVPLLLGGDCIANAQLKLLSLTGSPAFTLRNHPTLPISLTSRDSVLIQYAGSGNPDTAYLHIQYDLGSGPLDTTVMLTGSTFAPPSLLALQPKIGFGPISSCDTRDTTVYLKNTGCDSLTITSISNLLDGFSNNPPITLPITIAKGDSVAVHISYHPTSLQDSANLVLDTKHGNQTGLAVVRLSGQIRTTELSPSSMSLGLSTLAICGSADTTISFTNPGCDTMIITAASLSPIGDVQLLGVSLPIVIPPNSDTTFRLHFSSQKAETENAVLSLTYTVHGIPYPTLSIPVSAVATTPNETLALSDTELSIASLSRCSADTLRATIANPSCDTLVVSADSLSGNPDFVVLGPLDSVRILPGDSISVSVAVIPQAKGLRSAVLHIHYSNSLGTVGVRDSVIDLSAMIVAGAVDVTESLASVNLGTVTECAAADTLVTLRNRGCDTVTIDSGTLDNSFVVLSPAGAFPIQIPPDSSVNLRITTQIDTAGHPTALTSTLAFQSKTVELPPIPISYSVSYAQPLGLELVPMAGTAPVGSTIYYDVRDTATLANFGVTDVRFSLHVSQDLLGYVSASSLNTLRETSNVTGVMENYDFEITGSPVLQQADGTLARLFFKSYVAPKTYSSITIDSTALNPGDSNFERCTAYLVPQDTALNIMDVCGDPMLRRALNGQPIVLSVRQEDAGSWIVIHSPESHRASLTITNVLGVTVAEEALDLSRGETDVPFAQGLANGAYFITISDESGLVARASMVHVSMP